MPFVERVGRLHIVMAVNEQGRTPRRSLPASIDKRMAGGRNDPDIIEADAAQMPREPVRAFFLYRLHVSVVR
jgi:hypothetical protein